MLNRNFNESKKNYISKNKWTLIALGVFVLVGILVAAIFGFNGNPDFKGCNVVNVNVGTTTSDSKLDDYNSKLDKIFASNDLNLYSVQLKGVGAETTLEIKYTGKKTQSKIDKVNADIVSELEVDASQISEHKKVSATIDSADYIWTVVAGLLILIFASVFVAIRHNLAYAMCTLGAGAYSVLAILSAYAILRLEIGASFMFVVIASMVFAIFEALIWFENMRDVRKNKEYKDDFNKQLTLGLKSTNKQLQFTSISLFVVGLIMVIFGTKLSRNIALSFMFAIVAGLLSLMFVLPLIYNLTVDKVKFRPFKSNKDKKTKTIKDATESVVEERTSEQAKDVEVENPAVDNKNIDEAENNTNIE